MVDAVIVHKYLKAKFIAENSNMSFSLYEDYFLLREYSGKPLKSSKELDDILKYLLDNYEDLGYYTS